MSINPIPKVFINVVNLGPVLHIYPVKKSHLIWNIIGLILFMGATTVVFSFGSWYVFNQWQRYGIIKAYETINILIIIGGLLLVVGLLISWSLFNLRKRALVIFRDGIAYYDRKGLRAWHWEEIISLTADVTKHYTNGIYSGASHTYTVQKKSNQKIILNDTLTNIEEIANQIRVNVYPLLFRNLITLYNSGQTIVFGPITVGRIEGIKVGQKDIPWDQVEHVAIRQGFIQVSWKSKSKSGRAKATVSSIPNLEVLLAIIEQVNVNSKKLLVGSQG